MKRVLAIAVAMLLFAPTLAHAVSVKGAAGQTVVVYGIPKDGKCVQGANGNQVCGGVVTFQTVKIGDNGSVKVDVPRAERNKLNLLCARIDATGAVACGAPSVTTLTPVAA